MRFRPRLCVVFWICSGVLFAQDAAAPTDAAGWMSRGVEAFKQYKSADSSPQNLAEAEKAEDAFEEVLKIEPANKIAPQYLATLAFQRAAATKDAEEKNRRLDEARSWYQKLTSIDPRGKESWCSLGVIDWLEWNPKYTDALKRAGMKPDESRPIPDEKIRVDLRNSGRPLADDGIANLQKALDIDPAYAQALGYMNLFVRSRAYTDDTSEEFQKDIMEANDWAAKASKARPFPSRIRVGGNVEAANLIKKVAPKYPKEAKKAGIQGTVRFQVIIGKDGHVQSVQLVSGDPALVEAAQDAVQQWVYKPTTFNAQPVEVVTVIDVNFTLRP